MWGYVSDRTCSVSHVSTTTSYGSASEEVFGYNVAVLVGAGIGATPAACILKVSHSLS